MAPSTTGRRSSIRAKLQLLHCPVHRGQRIGKLTLIRRIDLAKPSSVSKQECDVVTRSLHGLPLLAPRRFLRG